MKKIALLPGDGIGPEIVAAAVRVLDAVGNFTYEEFLIGGAAIDAAGCPLPQATLDGCLASDSVLLGAVGGPKWDTLPGNERPEVGLLQLRGAMKLYSNLRPAKLYSALRDACPLKYDGEFDILIVRELTGGIYFGERGQDETSAWDTEKYSIMEIERIAHVAFQAARKRNKRVTSIDKANVLNSSRLWREVVHNVAKGYPDVTCEDMLVDNAAMQLIRNPGQFDVIVTTNMFGDILSDEASQLTGSIGMLPSSSLGDGTRGLYEPIHGSAPDIAGQGVANPIATILSAAMMLRYSFNMETEATAIESAVDKVLNAGRRTGDIAQPSEVKLGTKAMTDEILKHLQ